MTRTVRIPGSLALAVTLALHATAGPAAATETITLDEAWRLVLTRHPVVEAASADLAARTADADQAGRGLNPELEFEIENFAGSGDFGGFETADLTLQISQTWERGGKADGRRRTAAARLEASRATAERTRRELRGELVRAFVRALAAQRRVALADSLAHVADLARRGADRRVAAGAENPVVSKLARLTWSEARREQQRTRQELSAARLRLGALWGEDAAAFPALAGDLGELVPIPSWESILERVDAAPALRTATAELVLGRAGVELARSGGASDLTTAVGLRHFRGLDDNAFIVSVGIPLAVRDRNRDAVRAAAADVTRLEAARRAAAADLKSQLAEAWSRLTTSQSDVLAIRRDMLPIAADALEEAERAYERGRYSLTDVIVVRRTLAAR
jgi:cobalt-zinc-cadmium efflux system outer membrane protein